jgi:hypothetical protein
MKRVYNKLTRYITALAVVVAAFTSCEYERVADYGDLPEQVVYMPAAYYNPFMIDVVPERRGFSPTPGFPVRFTVDNANNMFNVLLGVYRAGAINKGGFKVDIAVDNSDTIANLITAGVLSAVTEILPSDRYSLPSSVEIKDGESLGAFDMEVDLDFLRAGYPDKIYAIGVGITCEARKVNEDLATTIIVIDTKIMKPTAGFTYAAATANSLQINFTNTSLMGMEYSWNFGDGSALSTEKNPSHTYAAGGSYTVTLTVNGVAGAVDQSVATNMVDVVSVPVK